MKHASRGADGSFEVEGRRYRLRELGGAQFAVDDEQGRQVGQLRLVERPKGGKGPAVIIEEALGAPDVVKRIAKLLEMPRGLLPVQ
ncbi:MAG TPA: hypothetical protein VKZ49_07735 [Polyangiaceae bacterium]|nr:hypothetical protein [Polyangiaceae bacterium]